MDRGRLAFWLVVTGLLVGVVGDILFYGKPIGLSFPLFTLTIITVLLAAAVSMRSRPRNRNLWLLLPVIFFSAMVAVRANPEMAWLNVCAVLGLGALALHYLPAEYFLDEETLPQHIVAELETVSGTIASATSEYVGCWRWVREQNWRNRAPFGPIARGAFMTIPVVVVFSLLLGSADVVFARYLERVWDALVFESIGSVLGHGLFILMLGWLTTGVMAYGITRRVAAPEAESQEKRKPPRYQISIIESSILLGSLDLLFGLFVLIQFTYLFGGEANISAQGFTYAQYARRGFFELLAVSIMTLGLVLLVDWITVRRTKWHHTIFQGLAVMVAVLMVAMLFSAIKRLLLYEEAYGFTHARVYAHVFMAWLGALFGVFLLSVFRVKRNVFSLGVLTVAIGYLVTLNLMNVDLYIARHNIERYKNGEELDICYLRSLSLDALPAMVTLHDMTAELDPDVHEHAEVWIVQQLRELRNARDEITIFSFNLARERAWTILNGLRGELELQAWVSPYQSCRAS